MNEKIKLIALDLDDTTLGFGAVLAPETEKAIKKMIAEGVEIVIASGRAFTSLPASVTGIPGIRYAICSNGATIVSVPGGERICAFTLRPDCVFDILRIFEGELFETFIDGKPFCPDIYYEDPVKYGCSPSYIDYVKTTRTPIHDMPGLIADNADRLDSIDVLCVTPERKNMLQKKTAELKHVFVTSSAPRLLEISDENAGKGKALRYLADMLGIDRKNVAAFGNGDNDADMLAFAGVGVAVSNASERCKASADIICESNTELGVAKTLTRFSLSKKPL